METERRKVYITGSVSGFSNPLSISLMDNLVYSGFSVIRSDIVGNRYEEVDACADLLVLADREWVQEQDVNGQRLDQYAQGLATSEGKTIPEPIRCFAFPLADWDTLSNSFLGKNPNIYWLETHPISASGCLYAYAFRHGHPINLRAALGLPITEYKNLPDPAIINKHLGIMHNYNRGILDLLWQLCRVYSKWLYVHPFSVEHAIELLEQDNQDYNLYENALDMVPPSTEPPAIHPFVNYAVISVIRIHRKTRMPRWADDNPFLQTRIDLDANDPFGTETADMMFADISEYGFDEMYWYFRWLLVSWGHTTPCSRDPMYTRQNFKDEQQYRKYVDAVEKTSESMSWENADFREKEMQDAVYWIFHSLIHDYLGRG